MTTVVTVACCGLAPLAVILIFIGWAFHKALTADRPSELNLRSGKREASFKTGDRQDPEALK